VKKQRNGRGGDRKSISSQHEIDSRKRLKDLGVTYDQTSQYQQMAAIPEEEFEVRLAHAKRDPRTASTQKMLKPVPQYTEDPEPEQWKRQDIWATTNGWLYDAKKCEPVSTLQAVPPTGGLRAGIQRNLAPAPGHIAGGPARTSRGPIHADSASSLRFRKFSWK
jgi:hypothetical protein